MDTFFTKYGYDYQPINAKPESKGKKAKSQLFDSLVNTETKSDYILVQEYSISTNNPLISDKEQFTAQNSHTLRVERYIGPKDGGSNAKYVKPTLIDFDGFMRGNPYPQPPKFV